MINVDFQLNKYKLWIYVDKNCLFYERYVFSLRPQGVLVDTVTSQIKVKHKELFRLVRMLSK